MVAAFNFVESVTKIQTDCFSDRSYSSEPATCQSREGQKTSPDFCVCMFRYLQTMHVGSTVN
jgi:hypothetical protein